MVGSECINTVLRFDANNDWATYQIIAEGNKRKNLRRKINKVLKSGGTIKQEANYYFLYNANNCILNTISLNEYDKIFKKGIKKSNK